MRKNGIILTEEEGKYEMRIEIVCHECEDPRRATKIEMSGEEDKRLDGLITCLTCGNEFPIAINRNNIEKLGKAMPNAESAKLPSTTPNDIKDDVKEAERAHYAQCYKACVAMCRRALQLSLIEKDIEDTNLGEMLKNALSKGLLTSDTYELAKSIKRFGDKGVHRNETLDSKEVELVIYATVRMLNELFPELSANANESK